ncbi:hypothetical protein LIA77_04900 [Sarocladium implicatum]|nr:hypothetical protein LIA77_04900 [Sarocladium implicatum]
MKGLRVVHSRACLGPHIGRQPDDTGSPLNHGVKRIQCCAIMSAINPVCREDWCVYGKLKRPRRPLWIIRCRMWRSSQVSSRIPRQALTRCTPNPQNYHLPSVPHTRRLDLFTAARKSSHLVLCHVVAAAPRKSGTPHHPTTGPAGH